MTQVPKFSALVRKNREKKKLMERLGLFSAVFILNLVVLLVVAGRVIYSFQTTRISEPVAFVVQVKPTPPPVRPPSKGGAASKSLIDPSVVVQPPMAPAPAIIISAAPNTLSLKMNSPLTMPIIPMSPQGFSAPSGSGLASGTTGGGMAHSNPFGHDPSEGVPGLMGELYDLKQTADGNPTPIAVKDPESLTTLIPDWRTLPATLAGLEVLRRYVRTWDQSILDQYYKAPVTLEASQIFIPTRRSEEATRAFGVADKVVARRWVIHYHGNIVPPKSGRFRFLGFGDDFLVVRLGNKNVLDGSFAGEQLDPLANGKQEVVPGPVGYRVPYNLRCGQWFDVEANQPVAMDGLIGEGPGGSSGFFLLIQEQGDPSTPGDYPVFQVAPTDLPEKTGLGDVFTGKKLLFGAVQ